MKKKKKEKTGFYKIYSSAVKGSVRILSQGSIILKRLSYFPNSITGVKATRVYCCGFWVTSVQRSDVRLDPGLYQKDCM